MPILKQEPFFTNPLSSYKKKETRYLIITADDFGASEAINSGVYDGINYGIINTVAAMVTFDDAAKSIKKLHRKNRKIGIGLHLSISSGKPVSQPNNVKTLIDDNGFFKDIDTQLANLNNISLLEVKSELQNQINVFKKLKIPIDSLSSQHNILNLYTPFFKIMLNLATQNKIPIRSVLPSSLFVKELSKTMVKKRAFKMATNLLTNSLLSAFYLYKHSKPAQLQKNQDLLKLKNIVHPDYLIDSIWGDPSTQNLFKTLVYLPYGVSELVFHIGKFENECDDVIHNIEADYFLMREMELLLATNKRIKTWLELLNIKTITYSDIKKINFKNII